MPEVRLGFGYGLPTSSIAPGDYDADGFADLFLVEEPDGEPTRIGILRGFDVPWDDPTYW